MTIQTPFAHLVIIWWIPVHMLASHWFWLIVVAWHLSFRVKESADSLLKLMTILSEFAWTKHLIFKYNEIINQISNKAQLIVINQSKQICFYFQHLNSINLLKRQQRMSRTSLGQKNDLKQREDVISLKQIQSVRRINNYQEQLFQTHTNLYDEVQYFLHMKDRYIKVEKEHKFMDFERDYGESYNNIKDGYGIHVFANGDRYIGFWEKSTMHGMGIYVFKTIEDFNRVAYLGEFYNGKFHGIGKLVRMQNDVNGEIIYKGTWFQGKKAQNGVYFYEHPSVYYQGGWLQDQRSGEGKLVFPNGQFIGQWEHNIRNGHGKLRKTQNNMTIIYEGIWKNDELNEGQITYLDANGIQISKYRGQILDGKKHGQGTYKMNNFIYEGNFENDSIKGEGVVKANNFNINGFYSSSRGVIQNGQNMTAQLKYDNQDVFEGFVSIVQGNVLRQKGVYKFHNGDIVEGQFYDNAQGKLQGSYLYRYKNGEKRNF